MRVGASVDESDRLCVCASGPHYRIIEWGGPRYKRENEITAVLINVKGLN